MRETPGFGRLILHCINFSVILCIFQLLPSATSFRMRYSSLLTNRHVCCRSTASYGVLTRSSLGRPKCVSGDIGNLTQKEHYTDNAVNVDIERLRGKKITDYWLSELNKLDRPSARVLISQLNADTPLGFEPVTGPARKGTLLDFTIQQKTEHEDKVILIRNGEFYETYGVDALMLINYCGLNPMANKAKAGCPLRNVQQTLDGLTAAGLSAAVYEEVSEIAAVKVSSSAAVGKPKIKHRILTQIVSPASTTYAYDLCLRSESIDYKENKPIVAIMQTVSGYSLYEIWLDEKRIALSQRLTLEAVRTMVEQFGHVEPAYVFDSSSSVRSSSSSKRSGVSLATLPFLSSVETIEGVPDEKACVEQVLRRISRRFEVDTNEFRWQQTSSSIDRPRSIYTSTALQIGLFENPNVPDLVPHLLPPIHYAHSAKFLKNWILHPPERRLADEMRTLCSGLASSTVALPPFIPIPVGKLVSLLYAKQANINLLREVRQSVSSVLYMLTTPAYEPIRHSLFELTASEVGGIKFTPATVTDSCTRILQLVDDVICSDKTHDGGEIRADCVTTDTSKSIPSDFFVRNEEEFRNKVTSSLPEVKELYARVHDTAVKLIEAVNSVVHSKGQESHPEVEVVFDIFNNAIMFRDSNGGARPSVSQKKTNLVATAQKNTLSIPTAASTPETAAVPRPEPTNFIPFVDRKGVVINKRYTTKRVQEALAEYQAAVESAPLVITSIIQNLCLALISELMTIIFASHWAIIITAMNAHVGHSIQQQWVLSDHIPAHRADISDHAGQGSQMRKIEVESSNKLVVEGLTPYWLSRRLAVRNNISLTGLFLLTAPNMSGKSTLMRSIVTAALLANCGLYIPASRAAIPRYDNFFLRSASYDIPKEGKSAFALEMDDVRILLRDCTNRSIVMLDEIGKGTSARDGAALAGALLEHLDHIGVSGVFATHLHELFRLPLKLSSGVQKKRMGITFGESSTGS
jgi:hypothetical protein